MTEPVLFACPRMPGQLRLTPVACAALWQRGRKASAWERGALCRGCEIGALNAGVSCQKATLPETLCVRCGNTGSRLIRNQLCVSCYNREREAARGRYRRGRAPRNPLTVDRLSLSLLGARIAVLAASRIEVALWALKRDSGATLGRWVPYGGPLQGSLLPGI
jgi:hypothetical protein